MGELFARELENIIDSDDVVIDMGSGTGILGVRSYQLGAWQVLAGDINREAVSVTRANFDLFGIDGQVFQGDLFGPFADGSVCADKILFATDALYPNLMCPLKEWKRAFTHRETDIAFTDEEIELILGGAAKKVLRLDS